MRKQLKKKKHSCRSCKPHKMGISNRWKPHVLQQMKLDNKEIKKYFKGENND